MVFQFCSINYSNCFHTIKYESNDETIFHWKMNPFHDYQQMSDCKESTFLCTSILFNLIDTLMWAIHGHNETVTEHNNCRWQFRGAFIFVLYSPNHVNFQFCWRKVLSNKSHSSDYSKLIAPINLQRCIECARALALTNSTVLYLSESKRAHLWMGSSVRYGICDIKTHRHRSTNKNKLLLFEYTKAKR